MLDAPQKPENIDDGYVYQVCISWIVDNPHLDSSTTSLGSSDQNERVRIVKDIARNWAEPFQSFVSLISDTTNVTQLDLDDFAPYTGLHSTGRVVLVGDAWHAMTMCKLSCSLQDSFISKSLS